MTTLNKTKIKFDTFVENGIVMLRLSNGKIVSSSESTLSDPHVGESVMDVLRITVYWAMVGLKFLSEEREGRLKRAND